MRAAWGGTQGQRTPGEDCEAAAAGGFAGVELHWPTLAAAGREGQDAVRRALERHGLLLAALGPLDPEQAPQAARLLAAWVGPHFFPTVVVVRADPAELKGLAWAQARRRLAERAAGLAARLLPAGGRVALELAVDGPMGTPERLVEVALASGRPDVGVAVDAFTCWRAGVAVDRLATLPADRVLLTRVSGAPDGVPPAELTDADRRLPARDSALVVDAVRALVRAGYQGWLSVAAAPGSGSRRRSGSALARAAFVGVRRALTDTLTLRPRDEALRAELLALAKPLRDRAGSRALTPAQRARLDEVLAAHGWPGWSLVGRDGAAAAWLLVQHVGVDWALFRRVRDLLDVAVQREEAEASHLAFLEDRLAVLEGRPQRYGTQFQSTDDGGWRPFPIEDESGIDGRRAAARMSGFGEYIRQLEAHGVRVERRDAGDD